MASVDSGTHLIMRIVGQVSAWDGAPGAVAPRAIPFDLFPREMKRIDFSGLESPYAVAGTRKPKWRHPILKSEALSGMSSQA
ncbi:hypothetical protein [uncultured Rhodoblastus sp.]|uniref:hypothetical protein n=1 Tax=uncultured Rhodoblastus sp. TaxID=543037 RepID=UPI0025E59D8E|nr:hypothetical protein [uncultured Rhodoblastus sp.]